MRNLVFKEEEANKERLDIFLSKKIEDFSRSQIQKIIKESVFVNDLRKKPNYKVQKGDVIKVQIPEKEEKLRKQNIPLDIRYEDDDLLIVFKPKGMIVHPTDTIRVNTLVNALLYHYDSLSDLSGENRQGIVHRLDKDTTGLLLIDKNNDIHEKLQNLFKKRLIKKVYYSLCYGVFKEKSGEIFESIGRNPSKRSEMAVGGLNARSAHTSYNIVWEDEDISLAEVHLDTGRTHQIRVHMKYIHHPIVGDPVYGLKKEKIRVSSQLLSACRLEFVHPNTKKNISVQSKPDDEFLSVLDKIQCDYFKEKS